VLLQWNDNRIDFINYRGLTVGGGGRGVKTQLSVIRKKSTKEIMKKPLKLVLEQ
jgi:hypothetical protein